LPPANGWVWVKGGQKYKKRKAKILLPPSLSAKSKIRKIFLSFFSKSPPARKKEKEWKIFRNFESQFKTGAEAGAYKSSKIFLKKGSSAVVNVLRIPTFSVFGGFFVSGVYRRPVRLGLLFTVFGV